MMSLNDIILCFLVPSQGCISIFIFHFHFNVRILNDDVLSVALN